MLGISNPILVCLEGISEGYTGDCLIYIRAILKIVSLMNNRPDEIIPEFELKLVG